MMSYNGQPSSINERKGKGSHFQRQLEIFYGQWLGPTGQKPIYGKFIARPE
jgi:hypothetical protein